MNEYQYFDLKTKQKEPTSSFILDSFLNSRIKSGLESNKDFYDEDVNIYIVLLLTSYLDPEYQKVTQPYLYRYRHELWEKIDKTNDTRFRFTAYKVNADNILISLGIFGCMGGCTDRPHAIYSLPRDTYINCGKAYYSIASEYSYRISHKKTALCEVLEKLSLGFDNYIKILSFMRTEYLNLRRKLTVGERYHLHREIANIEQNFKVIKKQEELLDLVSEWLKTKNIALKNKINQLSEELENIGDNKTVNPGEFTDSGAEEGI